MPIFKHDCKGCQFVATIHGSDWYVCPSKRNPNLTSIIGRYGDDSYEYQSYNPMSKTDYPKLSALSILANAVYKAWLLKQHGAPDPFNDPSLLVDNPFQFK